MLLVDEKPKADPLDKLSGVPLRILLPNLKFDINAVGFHCIYRLELLACVFGVVGKESSRLGP